MNFYQQNRHLFDDEEANAGPGTRINQLDQFISKPRPVPNFPKFQYYEKEPLQLQPQPQAEGPKTVFSQNARNLLGNNYNEKYETPYDKNSYAGRKDYENRSYDLPGSYNQPYNQPLPDNNMKNLVSPFKVNYNQNSGAKTDSLTNLDRYNPTSSYDPNPRIGSISSISKQGPREQYAQEDRRSYQEYKEPQQDNSYAFGAKSMGRNIQNDPYKRIEGLPPLPDNRGGMNNNTDRYVQNKPNYGAQQQQQQQDRVPAWQNDNIRSNPVRSNVSQQGPDSRNYLGNDSGRNENKYMPPQTQQNVTERSQQGRVSHNESGGYSANRMKDSSSSKVPSKEVTFEDKKSWRFPHDEYQAIKRRAGASDITDPRDVRPHLLSNWQARLSELNAIKNRRTLAEALERRLLNSMNPERKNRLKAALRGE